MRRLFVRDNALLLLLVFLPVALILEHVVHGSALAISCGSVREGVSRDAARAVFDVLRREVQP